MKKLLILLIAAMFLVACGSSDDEVVEDTEIDKPDEAEAEEPVEDVEEVEVAVDENGMLEETEDPLEAGNKNNGIEVFNDGYGEIFLIKDWYTNENTDEDGFNVVDFEGYEIRYAITLVETIEEEDVIGVFAEVENGTEHELQFNDAFMFVTDTKDQTELEHGIQINKPDTKSKFFNYATLEYGTPEELTVEIYPPFADGESELIDIGETVELEFTK